MRIDTRLDTAANPEAAVLSGGTTLADALRELIATLTGLKAALKRKPLVERLAYRIDEAGAVIGMSRRAIERERSAGRFPAPDLHIGKCPLWRVSTIQNYLESGNGGNR